MQVVPGDLAAERTRIFPGDSEMAQQMRAFDWSSSEIGPPETWPYSLRTALGICLTSLFPTQIWWGPSLTLFYSDAFMPFLGRDKHPAVLGRSAREAWSEIWDTISPIIGEVVTAGVARTREDIVIVVDRERGKEEVHVTFSFSPIFGEDGTVVGMFSTCNETTEKRIGHGRLDTLLAQRTMQIALEASDAAIWDLDLFTNRVTGDTNLARLFSLSTADVSRGVLPSETFLDVIHPDDRPMVEQRMRDAIVNAASFEVDCRLLQPAGELVWIVARGRGEHDSLGRPARLSGLIVDVTARKQAEARDRFLFQLLDATRVLMEPEAITATAARMLGEYLHADRCAYAPVEADEDHFIITGNYTTPGMISIVGRFAMSDFGEEALRLSRLGEPYVVVDAANDPRVTDRSAYAATQIGAVISVPLLKAGRFVAGMAAHQRVPRHWTSDEIELTKLVANLCWESIQRAQVERALRANEERLQQLYIQEQAAREEAETASRLKDEFLATVSHELRTPLTAILGYGQLIQTRQRDAAYITRTLDKIVQSAKTQAQLIEDLLDVSRIISGKLRLSVEVTDLIAIIHAAIDAVRPALEAKEVHLHTDLASEARIVVGDPNRLQQVVWNLLSNAIKFTPSSGTVRVHLVQHNDTAQISVSDTGQGISPEFLPYVFDRFRQADGASTRRHGGLGLGLSIVRHLMEMHGGTVEVQSEGVGKGATFTVYLPLAPEAQPAVRSIKDERETGLVCPPELHGLRVLVVDDQPDILELLCDILVPCGVVVRTSDTARGALVALQSWQPDVLISDIAMPDEDGYWLIHHVRELGSANGGMTPAIALTAYVRVEDRTQVLAAGFQLYVPKPVEPAELLNVLASLVKT